MSNALPTARPATLKFARCVYARSVEAVMITVTAALVFMLFALFALAVDLVGYQLGGVWILVFGAAGWLITIAGVLHAFFTASCMIEEVASRW